MSLEITIYTKNATKQKLINELMLHDFHRSKSIIKSPNSHDEAGFMWYGTNNYESFTGVEATVRRSTKEERKKYNCSEWILQTRTRLSGSHKDKEKQNVIIKHIRKLFGGKFYNDWYGTNTYTKLSDYPNLTAPERGLSLMKINIQNKISSIQYSLDRLPKSMIKPDPDKIEDESFREFIKSIDPSLTLYNAMFPFLVSLIEFMFKESFLILIRYNADAQKIIEDENIKVPLKDVLKVNSGEKFIEDIIADSFTFQNLGQVNKAYNKYLKIDIAQVLSRKKKVQNNIYRLYQKIEEIINIRHRIVHHFGFYRDLDKLMFMNYLKTIEASLNVFLHHLEEKYKWSIDDI